MLSQALFVCTSFKQRLISKSKHTKKIAGASQKYAFWHYYNIFSYAKSNMIHFVDLKGSSFAQHLKADKWWNRLFYVCFLESTARVDKHIAFGRVFVRPTNLSGNFAAYRIHTCTMFSTLIIHLATVPYCVVVMVSMRMRRKRIFIFCTRLLARTAIRSCFQIGTRPGS